MEVARLRVLTAGGFFMPKLNTRWWVIMFPIEIIRQFLRYRQLTLAFRCTCKEYSGLTGFGWDVWRARHTYCGQSLNYYVIPYYKSDQVRRETYARECVLAGLDARMVHAGDIWYTTKVRIEHDQLHKVLDSCTGVMCPRGSVVDLQNFSYDMYSVSFLGAGAADIIAAVKKIKAVLVPAWTREIYSVYISMSLPAAKWEWLEDVG